VNDLYRAAKVAQDPNTGYAVSLKLRKDATVAQANAELEPVVQEMARVRPAYFPVSFRVNLQSIVDLYARPLGTTLYVLLAAVTSLLLIGCGNVSILLSGVDATLYGLDERISKGLLQISFWD
jgi:hypothetical protein